MDATCDCSRKQNDVNGNNRLKREVTEMQQNMEATCDCSRKHNGIGTRNKLQRGNFKTRISYVIVPSISAKSVFVRTLIIIYLMAPPSSAFPFTVSASTKKFCQQQNGFTKEQTEFCFQNIELVKIFQEGFRLGHKECENTFKDSLKTRTRWNCTNLETKDGGNVFFGVPQAKAGSKEASIMTAFTAAGMLYNLIKKCQSGALKRCKPSELYDCETEGASSKRCRQIDLEVPKRLLDTFFLVSLGSLRIQIDTQNRNIGFKTIKELIFTEKGKKKEDLRPLRTLNEHFLKLYKHQAFRLKKKDLVNKRIPTLKLIGLRLNILFQFREDKFNYCGKSAKWNWIGIGRRPCKFQTRDSFSIENCVNMCCDFGYIKIPEPHTVCKMDAFTNEKKCRVEEYSYYCKHGHETRKKPGGNIWRDQPQTTDMEHEWAL